MSKKNIAMFLIILFVIFWFIGSIYYYTCNIKGLCEVQNQNKNQNQNNTNIIDNREMEINRGNSVVKKYTCTPYLKGFIKYGNKNSIKEVAKLENFLIKIKGKDIKIDGYYSKNDLKLVKEFQGENNQVEDGIVGISTRLKINELYCKTKVKEYLENKK